MSRTASPWSGTVSIGPIVRAGRSSKIGGNTRVEIVLKKVAWRLSVCDGVSP
jgi:hypothetical protein